MKKNYKKVYSYGIIMVVCVIVIVLVAVLSENRLATNREEFEKTILEKKSQIELLEDRIVELENEKAELEKRVESNLTAQSKLEKQSQTLGDLAGIYKLIKEGKTDEAKTAFGKIKTTGFEDSQLIFYEIINEMLKQ